MLAVRLGGAPKTTALQFMGFKGVPNCMRALAAMTEHIPTPTMKEHNGPTAGGTTIDVLVTREALGNIRFPGHTWAITRGKPAVIEITSINITRVIEGTEWGGRI